MNLSQYLSLSLTNSYITSPKEVIVSVTGKHVLISQLDQSLVHETELKLMGGGDRSSINCINSVIALLEGERSCVKRGNNRSPQTFVLCPRIQSARMMFQAICGNINFVWI